MSLARRDFEIDAAYLFGSRARGDHHEDSDIDIALVVPKPKKAIFGVAGELGGLAFDALLETGVLVSAVPISAQDWQNPENYNNPFFIESIKREGIPL